MVFNGCWLQEQICNEEEEWGFDELYDEIGTSEKQSEEHLNGELEGEANLISLNYMAMKNFCKAEGAADGDIMNVDMEIKTLMESIKNLQTTLSEDVKVGDIFRVETRGEQERGERITGAEAIKASFEEIEKLDAILRVKAAEERKAKLCRIQLEEESREILRKLPCLRSSSVIKENLEEFIRLLNDLGESESESSGSQSQNRVDGAGDKEKNKNNNRGEKKRENRGGEERKAKHFKFIEKNIQLAKCGRGTLSLTDEEKQRVEELLEDLEETDRHPKGAQGLAKDFYAIDDETKSVLTKIDQQLEAVIKAQNASRFGSKSRLLEKIPKEKDVIEKCDKSKEKEKTGEQKKKKNDRLAEINKLLNAVNSVTHEEITPLSEEEIVNLLEQSKQSLDEGRGRDEGQESLPTEGAKGSEDVILELVANAKLLMPKFKYRFVDT